MTEITVRPLEPDRFSDAARVLAHAFATNPLHRAAFGLDVLRRNEAFFLSALGVMTGTWLAAFDRDRLVGVVHWVEAPDCQLSFPTRLRVLPRVVGGLGVRCAMRVLSWMSAWSAEDPATAHVHLGPIGVHPERQGCGVGRLLMNRYCDRLDASGRSGYLETDRRENVAFYQRFGFETVREISVLGVTNFLMERPSLTQ